MLHDNSATIPVSLALIKLKIKELIFFQYQAPKKEIPSPTSTNTEKKRFDSVLKKISSFSLPSKRIFYSYIRKMWFYLQKIIITLLSVLAAIIYFRNYLRLVREERERQANNVAIPQPQSPRPPVPNTAVKSSPSLSPNHDLDSALTTSSISIENRKIKEKLPSNLPTVASSSTQAGNIELSSKDHPDAFLALAQEYQRRSGVIITKDSKDNSEEDKKNQQTSQFSLKDVPKS